jgi:hypothetical protein
MNKKIALILFGISYNECYHHRDGKKFKIDFRNSFENYKQYIYDYFKNLNYDIDVYFATNKLDELNFKELIHMYKPIKGVMMNDDTNKIHSRNSKFIESINCCLSTNIKYDMCLITRFDLLFQKKFETSNFKFDTLNIVSILEKRNAICDNFYLLPYNLLYKLYEIAILNKHNNFHYLGQQFLQISTIHFIFNEYKLIADLSFYKIVRTPIDKT